jgi:hypothetical protein
MIGRLTAAALSVAGSMVLLVGLPGCGGSTGVDPALAAKLRQAWLLTEEPSGGLAVADVRELLTGEPADSASVAESADDAQSVAEGSPASEPAAPREVVLVGSVGGLPNPSEQSQPDYPFDRQRAVIFLADPGAVAEQEAEGHQHAPGEECAFCASRAADMAHMLAVVRFRDEQGKVVPIDARAVLDVKEKETVVVRGVARMEAGMLVVDAEGLYVRR